MRLINVVFIVLIAFVLMSVGYVYMQNTKVLGLDILLWNQGSAPVSIRVSSLLIGAFLLGFVLNLLYTGIMEFTRFVKGINASAATRASNRSVSFCPSSPESCKLHFFSCSSFLFSRSCSMPFLSSSVRTAAAAICHTSACSSAWGPVRLRRR